MKALLSLITAFLVGFVMISAANLFGVDINPLVGATATTAILTGSGVYSFVTGASSTGYLTALLREVWVADIAENLFSGHEFISHSIDDSVHVVNNKVHLPQAGTVPNVVKNRSSYPASIGQRTDTDFTYTVDNFTTDPIHVTDYEELQTSYDKRMSVMGEHIAKLGEECGDQVAYIWATSADADLVLRTTGANTADLPHVTATGARLKLTRADLQRLAKKLDKDKMPKEGRYLLLPPEMYYDLIGVDQLVRADFMGKPGLPEGAIDKILGFNIMVRANVVMYNEAAAGVKKAVGAAAAATDCLGAIAWSKYATRRAKGATKVYLNENQAEYYGDIMSAEVNLGAQVKYSDYRGVVAIAQGYEAP
jgi:hypothetical protein